jgi:hypothetical protein
MQDNNKLMDSNLYNFKIQIIFILFLIINLSILWINKNIIFDTEFYYRSLQSEISLDNIDNIILFNKKIDFFGYFILPFLLFFKWFFINFILFITLQIFEIKISFIYCFKIVLLAEIITIISSIVKTLYFYIYPPSNFEVLQYFNPLGITSFLKNDIIPKYLLYPIQQLTLFEVGYWLLLAYGIKSLGNVDFKKALKITSLSYGVGLLIWCIFIVFLQLQFS